jgi:hypothetical protein
MENKTCVECNESKPITEFYKDAMSVGGHRKNCKACKNKKTIQWRNDNREHYNRIARDNNQKHYQKDRLARYGITPDQHQEMLNNQSHTCGICGKLNTSIKRAFAVDHHHATGKVRGILCYGCNRYMALLDDAELLSKALAYAKKHS